VATASLIKAVKEGKVNKEAVIMLNITGGGIQRFKREHNLVYKKPDYVFPIDAEPGFIKEKVAELFG
jgi:cysteate synthase